MRTTIDLPDELLRQAKSHAALQGMTLKDLVTACLRQGLEKGLTLPTSDRQRRSAFPTIQRSPRQPIAALSNRELHKILQDEEVDRATRR
jgi:hypothetical protein